MNSFHSNKGAEMHVVKKSKMVRITEFDRSKFKDIEYIKFKVTDSEGRKVAYAKIVPSRSELFDIEVNKELQRHGIGTELFKKCMTDLKFHGCTEMTWAATRSSIPFYLRQGADYGYEYPSLGLIRMSIDL